MLKQRKLHLGDQEGLKLYDDGTPISKEEFACRMNELARCKNDIDYFLETYYRIVNPVGEKVVIKMFPKQRDLLHKIMDNNRIVTCCSRQTGKTETYSMFCVYQILFQKNYKILIAGNKGEIAREILTKIKDAYELIPNWMKPSIKTWNESKIVFTNGVVIKCTTTGPNSARGNTCDLTILDEFSFVLPSIQQSFFTAITPILASRPLSKLLVVSTPNGTGDLFHSIWIDATTNKKSVWTACRIDWWERPDRDEKWKELQIKTLGSQEKFDQEFGNRFTVAAGNKLVSDDKILRLEENFKKSGVEGVQRRVERDRLDCKYKFTEYFPYEKGRTYVGSADVAEGTGKDSSVFYIFDITEGNKVRMCAKFSSSKIITSKFAYVIYHMSQQYGKPWLFIESNSIGTAVIDALTKTLFRYEKIVTNRKDGRPGLFSHVQNKGRACLNAQEIIQSDRYELLIPDQDVFRELSSFEKVSTSQHTVYKAKGDAHDDHVMALIWGLLSLSEEFLRRYYTVEFRIDEDTKTKIPTLVIEQDDDAEDARAAIERAKNGNKLSEEEKFRLAGKWRMLGDDARADYILSTIYEEQFDETGGIWGNNPYQIDVSKFSEGLFGDRYKGMGRKDDFDYDSTFVMDSADASEYGIDDGGDDVGWL